jgi:hypothetical protein
MATPDPYEDFAERYDLFSASSDNMTPRRPVSSDSSLTATGCGQYWIVLAARADTYSFSTLLDAKFKVPMFPGRC